MTIDLDQVLDYVSDAKGTFGKEDDPLGYVAAVLEDVPLLVAELRDAQAEIVALRRALTDAEVLVREGAESTYAAAELIRMARTNEVVPQ